MHGDEDVGCGCAYPSYVDQTTVDCSNAIIERLRERAALDKGLVRQIRQLAMHSVVDVGGERIGIIYGDPESLAGWGLAVENFHPLGGDRPSRPGCSDAVRFDKRITDRAIVAH
ncbi:MAG: hypothetical protein KAR22_03685 [Gammaproteobacteria bacterium]|nr:hypothetical protein [Gammaproteobacteria bacterium]